MLIHPTVNISLTVEPEVLEAHIRILLLAVSLCELPVDACSVELVDIAHSSGAVQARHVDQHANERLKLLLGANRARI